MYCMPYNGIYAYIDPQNHPNVGTYGAHRVFGFLGLVVCSPDELVSVLPLRHEDMPGCRAWVPGADLVDIADPIAPNRGPRNGSRHRSTRHRMKRKTPCN